MKRIIPLLAIFAILLAILSSCGKQDDTVSTVRSVPLTEDERRIAKLGIDIVYKFDLEKDWSYVIDMYLYRDGSLETLGGMYGVDVADEDQPLLIGGRREENAGIAWSFSSDSTTAKFPSLLPDGDYEPFASHHGTAKGSVTMEPGQEYALVYAAFQDSTQMNSASSGVFSLWDTLEDQERLQALEQFTYAYIITARCKPLETDTGPPAPAGSPPALDETLP
jgi:hypothetical protein